MVNTSNVRVNIGGGAKPFFPSQISQVGFTVSVAEVQGEGESPYQQYQPTGISFDSVRMLLPTSLDPSGGPNPAIVAIQSWWGSVQKDQIETRDVNVEVLNADGSIGTALVLVDAVPTSYDPLSSIVTFHVGGIQLSMLKMSGKGPFMPGLSHSVDIGPVSHLAAGPNGGVTEISFAPITGGDPHATPVVSVRRITPFNVRLQANTNPALGDWIFQALVGIHQPRDLELYTGTQTPALIYRFTGTFLTRVILIGPSLAADDPGVMAVGAEITIQANGKDQ